MPLGKKPAVVRGGGWKGGLVQYPWTAWRKNRPTDFLRKTQPNRTRAGRRAATGPVLLFLVFFMVAALWAFPGFSGEGGQAPGYRFAWAAVKKSAQSANPRIQPLSDGGEMFQEDRLRVYIRPMRRVYFYLIHLDPMDRPTLLFPSRDRHPSRPPSKGPVAMLPGADSWYAPGDISGKHVFYFFAATGRFSELERLFRQYETCADQEAQAIARDILFEMKWLEMKNKITYKGCERSAFMEPWLGGAARISPEILDVVSKSWTLVDVTYVYLKKFEYDLK